MDKFLEILDKIEPLILVVIPTLFGIWIKTANKIKEKNDTYKRSVRKKALEKYDMWEHEESRRVIAKIKELCRVYKDRSKADEVMYLQLENGTVATSRLCNMFITCLAEDDRYSVIPKKIRKLQRVSYSQLSEWVEEVTTHECIIPDIQAEELHVEEPFFEDVGSHLSETVHDKDGYLIGMVVFNYFSRYFNEADEENQIDFLRQFQASIESVFISYHVARMDMKKQLHLDENEISENNNGGENDE